MKRTEPTAMSPVDRGGEREPAAPPAAAGCPLLHVEWHFTDEDAETADPPELDALRRLGAAAMPLCLAAAGPVSCLRSLDEVEVAVVDDLVIARLHAEYLDDPSVTDVITFDHGEIIINRETARREAAARGLPFLHELLLYIVHGLLHLGGHDDREPAAREQMGVLQERILRQTWSAAAGEP